MAVGSNGQTAGFLPDLSEKRPWGDWGLTLRNSALGPSFEQRLASKPACFWCVDRLAPQALEKTGGTRRQLGQAHVLKLLAGCSL